MKIGLTVNLSRQHAYEVTSQTVSNLISLENEILMSNDLRDDFLSSGVSFSDGEEWAENSDLIVAVGGDGTIIHASHIAAKYDKPILGINAGNLGFLAGLEKTELNLLEKLTSGDYFVDNRMMICCELIDPSGSIRKFYSLNDVVIARGNTMHMCDIDIFTDDQKSLNYTADGIIFSTPTGSTAYNLSAGGPVLDPTIESIIATPICPHSIFNRSVIFSEKTVLEVKVNNAAYSQAVLSPDGDLNIPVLNNSRVIIRKGNRYVKIIRLKSDNFVSVLKNKLSERRI